MKLHRPSPATLLAGAALFIALGGPAEAAKTLRLKKNSVTSTAIKNRTIAQADLSLGLYRKLLAVPAGGVTSASVKDGSLIGADLAPGSVAGDRLAPNSVASATVVDNSLTTNDIAANAVQSDEIANATITAIDIGADAVGATEVKAGAISSDEIEDGRLKGVDIGRFAGRTGDMTFGVVNASSCTTVSTASLTGIVADQNLADDAIVVTPPSAFPDGLSVYAKAGSTNTIKVTVCNPTLANVNVGSRDFTYVTVDVSGN